MFAHDHVASNVHLASSELAHVEIFDLIGPNGFFASSSMLKVNQNIKVSTMCIMHAVIVFSSMVRCFLPPPGMIWCTDDDDLVCQRRFSSTQNMSFSILSRGDSFEEVADCRRPSGAHLAVYHTAIIAKTLAMLRWRIVAFSLSLSGYLGS